MYSPIPDNPQDHLYEFTWYGQTGARHENNTVILTLQDGPRGDADLSVNGTVSMRGNPALLANIPTPGDGGGCSLMVPGGSPI